MNHRRALAIIIILLAVICGPVRVSQGSTPATQPASPAISNQSGCRACHPYKLGSHQQLSCVSCHGGNDQATTRQVAHIGLIPAPASPGLLQKNCGNCHPRQSGKIAQSSHFTLSGEINPVRRHFGAERDLASALEIPSVTKPATPLQLADDLLRRRCLRCHVYYRGDAYAETRHGTGCAACHLDYRNGKLVSHLFLALPDDRRCLACHYGNRVGGDYYGFFEHDFRYDFRTPFQINGSYPERPYGLEEHRLQPDIHRLAGLSCLDCHSGMHQGATRTISCVACHNWRPGKPLPAASLSVKDGKLLLKLKRDGRLLPVPPAVDPAHKRFGKEVDCAVCHALWSYDDQDTQLLRTDIGNYQDWADLIVQGSSEVESELENSLYGDHPVAPTMTDKFTGKESPGLWLKTFEQRRWENPPLGRDRLGVLRVMRPSLDLHLSWVDGQDRTVFDHIGGNGPVMRPYTPHTIGKAGTFYLQRLQGFVPPAILKSGGK